MPDTTRRSRQRSAPKRDELVEALRGDILNGSYAPGDRLPTRQELEARFAVGWTTVQRAMDQLREDGFIESRGRNGTFVADTPPHLNRYALAFMTHPSDYQGWSLRYEALIQAAQQLEIRRGVRVEPYYRINGSSECPDFKRLLSDAEARRLTGVIFVTPPYFTAHREPKALLAMPRVGLCALRIADEMLVSYGEPRFLDLALDKARELGRRRVAFLGVQGDSYDAAIDAYSERATACELSTKPEWIIPISAWMPQTGRAVAQLLLKGSLHDRPDAMVIVDDNIVEETTRGVALAGVHPDELTVITQVNFPLLPPAAFPTLRMGVDSTTVLSAAIDLIDRRRLGETEPDVVVIPAVEEKSRPLADQPRWAADVSAMHQQTYERAPRGVDLPVPADAES